MMPAIASTLVLVPVDNKPFIAQVQECKPKDKSWKCPAETPAWVTTLITEGVKMSLTSLTVQAGRHFSDRVNRAIFKSDITKRQAASAIAWTLISMVRPSVADDKLEVVDPVDKDIKRLCSEILGVGAGLEVLRLSTTIDGRTIRKLADRFDFEAFERGGTGKVLIEAKGTFQGVSANQHRSSFRKKLKAEGLWAAPTRGYSRAVGIIFSTWCEGKPRGVDVELLDPDGEPGDHFEDAVREVIRFYARRFDEASGDRGPAQTLFEVAESGELIVADPATLGIKVITEAEENAEDGLLTITGLSRNPSFVGGFHSAKAFPLPLAPDDGLDYGQAYVGVDSQILHAIAHRDFDALLKFHTEEGLFMVREGGFVGHFQLDAYGILRGLMTERPPLMTFGVRAEERPPVTSDALRK